MTNPVVIRVTNLKYQYNNVMALLKSYDLYLKNLETARNSQGWADEQVAIQYETISRQIKALNADFQQLIVTLDEAGASSAITWIIQGLRSVTQLLSTIDPNSVSTFSQLVVAFAAFKSLKGMVGVVSGLTQSFKMFFSTVGSGTSIVAGFRNGMLSLGTVLKLFGSIGSYAMIVGLVANAVYTLADAYGNKLAQATANAANDMQSLNDGFIGQYNKIKDQTDAVTKSVEAIRKYQNALKNANLSDEERSEIVTKLATEQGTLKSILGETSAAELEAAGYTEEAVKIALDAYDRKREETRILLEETISNELAESESVLNNTEFRIKNYDNEIAKLRELVEERRKAMNDSFWNDYKGQDSFVGRVADWWLADEQADIKEQEKRVLELEQKRQKEQQDLDKLRAERERMQHNLEVLQGKRKPKDPVTIDGMTNPVVEQEENKGSSAKGGGGSFKEDFSEKAKRNQYMRQYNELLYDGKIAATQYDNALKELDATEKFEGATVDTAMQRVGLFEERKKELEEYLKKYEDYQDTLMQDLDAEMAANQELAEAVGWKDDASVNEKLRTMEVNRELFQQIKSYSEIVNMISKVNQQIETTKGKIIDIGNQLREVTKLPTSPDERFKMAKEDYGLQSQMIEASKNPFDPYADERSLAIRLRVMKNYLDKIEEYRNTLEDRYNKAVQSGNEVQIRATETALKEQEILYREFANEIEKTQREAQEGIREGLVDITNSLVIEGNSWKEVWSNLWQDLAREAIQVLFGVQNVTKSFLGNIVGGFGKGKGSSGMSFGIGQDAFNSMPNWSFLSNHTGANVTGFPKMHSGGAVEKGRVGVVPQLRNDEVVRTLQVGEEVNSLADRRSNEILGAVAMKALDNEGNRPNNINIMALDSKSFAEYLNENSDILMAIIGKQQAMGRGTRR